MKTFSKSVLFLLTGGALCLCTPASATVIVDDFWADGMRTNLPFSSSNSVWYSSVGAALTATNGAMIGTMAATTSRTWTSYFTTNAASPVVLAVGETLKVTMAFTPTNVVASNNNTGFRIGLYDSSSGTRVSLEASPAGENVQGYMLGANFGTTFGSISSTNPLQLFVRTDLTNNALLSSSSVYTSLGSGGALKGSTGFASETPYTFTFSVYRTNSSSVVITTEFTGGALSGEKLSITDSATNLYQFDTFILRPARGDQTADAFAFTEYKVEVLSGSTPAAGLPFITSVVKSGTDVIISGTNGTVNGTYHVLATNNVAATKTAWQSILTNNFDSNGNFSFTNAIGSSQLFYLIQQQP
jgi:hypothetical protein